MVPAQRVQAQIEKCVISNTTLGCCANDLHIGMEAESDPAATAASLSTEALRWWHGLDALDRGRRGIEAQRQEASVALGFVRTTAAAFGGFVI
eukprot:5195340-Amphidinium_carterae.1